MGLKWYIGLASTLLTNLQWTSQASVRFSDTLLLNIPGYCKAILSALSTSLELTALVSCLHGKHKFVSGQLAVSTPPMTVEHKEESG